MKLSQKQIIILAGGLALVVILGFVFFFNTRPKPPSQQSGKLAVWGTEGKDIAGTLFSGYPYATVTYTQIDPSEYDSRLLSALAAGKGPDVFEIGNRSLPRWKGALAPLPAAYASQFGVAQLQAQFPDVVEQDFVSVGPAGPAQIYALPLSIDTLALFYNKDLFNGTGVVFPPKTWDEFEADVAKLRAVGAQGQITQAAAAIGGSETSIANAPDLVFLLMLQNGTKMTNDDLSSAEFASNPGGPGFTAFDFYLQFANAASPYYTWNDGLGGAGFGGALDSFANGKTAIFFGYAADLARIKEKAPFLKVGVAPMPQAAGASVAVNYPKYSGLAVAKVGQAALAWNFILYMATNPAVEKSYVNQLGAPPAQRSEIQADLNDPNLAVFAAQALTARSWYEADDEKIDAAMNAAIQSVLNGAADSARALQVAQGTVSALMYQRQ